MSKKLYTVVIDNGVVRGSNIFSHFDDTKESQPNENVSPELYEKIEAPLYLGTTKAANEEEAKAIIRNYVRREYNINLNPKGILC